MALCLFNDAMGKLETLNKAMGKSEKLNDKENWKLSP